MKRELFLHWLQQIYNTAEAEIDCERLQVLLPAFVDHEIEGGNLPAERIALVRAHLAHCPDCADEYEGLHTVARLEAQGGLPQAEEILANLMAEPEAAGGIAIINR